MGKAEIKERGLHLEFAAHPRETFRQIEAEASAQPTPQTLLALGEIAYRVGQKRATLTPVESLEWFRDAAVYASFVTADPSLGPEAVALHNLAVTQCLRRARGDSRRPDGNEIRGRLAEAGLVLEGTDPAIDPNLFERLDAAGDFTVDGLNRHKIEGMGVPMLAVRTLPDRAVRTGQERFFGPRLAPPLTAVVQAEGSPVGAEWRTRPTRLVTYDPIVRSTVPAGGRELPLAAEFTPPLAYQAQKLAETRLDILGALNPEKLSEKTGVYLTHPYQKGKIPVLFIHGLASSPGTWIPMFNELRADPVLRERYQFWFAYYPTGFPTAISLAQVRKELHDLQQTIDPTGSDPALKNMVVVGHSMGGLLSRMMIQSSGDAVWDSYFTKPRGQVIMNPQAQKWADSIFYFEPEPQIRRVVFIATPHRGANTANQVIGRVSSALVRRSPRVKAMREEIAQANGPEIFQPEYRTRMLSSIDNLEWESPMLKTLDKLPMAPDVPYHTVYGNITRTDNLDRVTDGVVNYESAHLDGAQSELMIPYFHTRCTGTPEPIAEVKRILHLHIGQ